MVLMTFFNCSCSLFASSPSTILEQIRKNERHEIRVGTALMAPAFDIFMCYRNDELIGFDADVARHIVQKLSKEEEEKLREPLRIRFIIYRWGNDLFKALQSGKVDFIIAGLSPTAIREKKYHLAFTHPYVGDLRHVLIFEDKEQDNSYEPKEPQISDKTTFVSARGTTQQDLAEFLSRASGGRVELVETFADGVFALIGRPDYILVGDEGLDNSIVDSPLSVFPMGQDWFQRKRQDPKFEKEFQVYQTKLQQEENKLHAYQTELQHAEKDRGIWNNELAIAVAQNQEDLWQTLNDIIRNEDEHLKKLKKFWFPKKQPPIEKNKQPSRCGAQQVDGFVYVEDQLPQ